MSNKQYDPTTERALCAIFFRNPDRIADELIGRNIDTETFIADPEIAPVFAAMLKRWCEDAEINEVNLRVGLGTQVALLDPILAIANSADSIDEEQVIKRALLYYQKRKIGDPLNQYAKFLGNGFDQHLDDLPEYWLRIEAAARESMALIALRHTGDAVERFFSKSERVFSTGYTMLDNLLSGGWCIGVLSLFLGSKKSGKTSLQANFTAKQIALQRPAIVVEREFTERKYQCLVLSVMTQIEHDRIRAHDDEKNVVLTPEERERVVLAIREYDRWVRVNTGIATVPQILAWARTEHSKFDYHPEALLQVDHLNLLHDSNGNQVAGLGMSEVGQELHDAINPDKLGNMRLPLCMTGQIDDRIGKKMNNKGELDESEFLAYGGRSPGMFIDEGFVMGLDPKAPVGAGAVIQQLVSRWGNRANFCPISVGYLSKTRTFLIP